MKTDAIYLKDSYAKEMDARVLEVIPEGDKRWRIILDKTVFYPMGGGQPTDQGVLASHDWSGNVYMVMMKDGEIGHYVQGDAAPFAGISVRGTIDWDRRYKNMRVHTAGHVVDFAMYQLGYSPKTLKPIKGDHGKKPYIVYSGILGKDIREELEKKSNETVLQSVIISTAYVTFDELQKDAIYLQPGLPTNKPLRKITFEGIGSVADGGTQVANTKEVGAIVISSIEEENGNTTVAYRV